MRVRGEVVDGEAYRDTLNRNNEPQPRMLCRSSQANVAQQPTMTMSGHF
jgi:hypothetical protein